MQLRDYCIRNRISIALIQEPIAQAGKVYGFEDCRVVAAKDPGAAIIIMNNDLQVIELTKHVSTHIAAIRMGHGPRSIILVSAYFKFNIHSYAFTEKLRAILESGTETIIGADTNGHSPRWHSVDLNQRGRIVEDLIDDYNLNIVNAPGHLDTYSRHGMGSSNIDVTLSTQATACNITGWLVSDATDSDHRLLSFNLCIMTYKTQESERYDTSRADWDRFSQELARSVLTVQTAAGLDVHASTLTDAITTAAKKAIPIRTGRRWNIKRQPWWTDRLTSMRKKLNLAKRQGLMLHDRQAYNRLRNDYLQEIRNSKMTAWRNMSNDINVHTWGKAFKYAKNGPRAISVTSSLSKVDGTHTETVDDTMDVLLDTFVPADPDQGGSLRHGPLEQHVPIDELEVKNAIWRMKPSKAPGLDVKTRQLSRGCPQGSQLGPTLWKVAMSDIEAPSDQQTQHVVTYADDIAILTGAARPHTAFKRMTEYLDVMRTWAEKYSLEFSETKTQLMSVKGGLKPPYSITFGTGNEAAIIQSASSVKYLGVLLDPRQSYTDHIFQLAGKSKDLYKRLRGMSSANWGMSRRTAKIIYEGVFLPRITYAAEVWWEGVKLEKCKKKLGSMQRDPLRAITSAYKTASTNCLTAVAGELPLDLKIIEQVFKRRAKLGAITHEALKTKQNELLEQWQTRYVTTDKGEWTKKMIPSVIERYGLPMEMDHYTSQILTGHGDFRGKLFSFNLVDSPTCKCALGGSETVAHVLLKCRRNAEQREVLKEALRRENQAWPPEDGVFLKSKGLYAALRKFARDSLKNRTDR
ncbi:hypothetical protein AGLY_018256 [Aphis glycines]|uniref:Reverse transcriptase domain-containing protein n=1 Tax=Aphis glycines TaxID=307491 RepID=A0A6G0SSU9_APHGL|nr:hypothetical protein AGLY_018256 [Aphis glycines]